MMTGKQAIEEAVRRIGGQRQLAAALGIRQPNIPRWIERGFVPPYHVLRIEFLTGVERHLLNPVIYPPPRVDIDPPVSSTEEGTPA